jgi:hypothetical protein
MKKILLLTFTILTFCIGGAYAQVATIAPAPLKPKWTCRFTNPITFSDGPTASWSQSAWPTSVDATGNAAVFVENTTGKTDVLWISSKGTLLAAIPALAYKGAVLSVSANNLYLITDGRESWVKYSLVKGKLVQSLPPVGDYQGAVQYAEWRPNSGMIGVTETDGVGNTRAISFFPF